MLKSWVTKCLQFQAEILRLSKPVGHCLLVVYLWFTYLIGLILFPVNTGYTEPPLRQAELEEAKRKRTTEIRQRRTVIEFISNVFFLWVIFSISYSNRDDRTYQLHETIINMMNANPSMRFDKVTIIKPRSHV